MWLLPSQEVCIRLHSGCLLSTLQEYAHTLPKMRCTVMPHTSPSRKDDQDTRMQGAEGPV